VGIYDRDYYREERPGLSLRAPQTIIGVLIAVNVAIWLADFLTPTTYAEINGRMVPVGHWLSDHLAVHVGTLTQPWLWWQYLTCGFAHSPRNFQHILFNMLGLFLLGRDVESLYGRREFLRVYLAMVVFAAVVWNIANKLSGPPLDWAATYGVSLAAQRWQEVMAYGASGAIAGVVILYALNFPRRTLLLFFVIPIPAWLLGVLLVGMDMYGAMGREGSSNVAYAMHLAGAAFAVIYFHQRWNLTRLTDGLPAWLRSWRRPKLRVHRPDEPEPDLSTEVDRILEKIYREGEASLTAKERHTLETASKEYQRKGKGMTKHE